MRRLCWINSPKSLRGLCARLNPIVEQFVLVVKRIRMNPAHIQKEMKLHMFVQSQFLIKWPIGDLYRLRIIRQQVLSKRSNQTRPSLSHEYGRTNGMCWRACAFENGRSTYTIITFSSKTTSSRQPFENAIHFQHYRYHSRVTGRLR